MSSSAKKTKIDETGGSVTTLEGELCDENQQLKRKIARPASKPVNGKESPISTGTKFLDLTEDSLIAIFEECDLMDLPAIARSCKYLKEITFQLFKRKHKIVKLNFDDYISCTEANQARRLLQTFGSMIIGLELNFKPYLVHKDVNSAAVVIAVIAFCTTLNTFKLSSFDIPDTINFFFGMGQLFGRLEKLHLHQVFIDECDDHDYDDAILTPNGNSISFFDKCKLLTKLKMEESYFFYQSVFANSFPLLEHIIIEDPLTCSSSMMDEFILRHPKLKTFSLDCEHCHIPIVAANCKSLETFGFQFGDEFPPRPSQTFVESLSKFRNLKKLICFGVGLEPNMSRLMQVLPKLAHSLEVLHLSHGKGTREFIKTVSSMKKLKVVRLHEIEIENTTPDDLKNLLQATVIYE